MKKIKRALAILLVMIVSFSVVSVGAEAVSVSLTNSDYGYMLPANYNFSKSVSTVYLNGSYDYINFYINSEYRNKYFFYEIYSDKNCTKLVTGDYTYCSDYGMYTYTPYIKLLGTFSTGTYYCVTYAADIDDNDNIKVSKPSMVSFKIVVNRNPSYSQYTVGLKSVTNTVDGPKVSWYKLNNSTVKYNIYRRYLTGTQWVKVGTVNGSTYTFTDKSVKNKNGRYVYTVRGVDKNGTLTKYHYSGVAAHYAAAPVVSSVSTVVDNRIQVKWNDVGSVAKYYIYRKENNGGWVLLKSKYNGTVFYDTTAKSGNNYRYTVRAFIYTNTGNAFSSFYNGKAVDYVEAPKMTAVNKVDNGIKLDWNAAKGATGYTVYRRKFASGDNWKEIARFKNDVFTFTDEKAEQGVSYTYTVRAEGVGVRGSYLSAGINCVLLDAPVITSCKQSDNYVYLEWKKVQHATAYEIYTENDAGEWELVKTVDPYFYEDITAAYFAPDRVGELKYRVRGIYKEQSHGEFSDIVSLNYYPEILGFDSKMMTESNNLYWESDVKTDKYNIYRAVVSDDSESLNEYQLLATINGGTDVQLEYIDKEIDTAKTYKYIVKSVFGDVEQPDNKYKETVFARMPISAIQKKVKVSYSTWVNVQNNIYLSDLDSNLDYKVFGYSYADNKWIELPIRRHEDYIVVDALAMGNSNGEYTISIVYCIDGKETPIDSVIYTEKFPRATDVDMVANLEYNGVRVKWNSKPNAQKYILSYTDYNTDENKIIEIDDDGSGVYNQLLEVDVYDENGVGVGIRITTKVSDLQYITNNYVFRSKPAPSLFKANSEKEGSITVYWENLGERFYGVYRKAENETTWSRIDTAIDPSVKQIDGQKYCYYIDNTAETGVKYTYTVKTLKGFSGYLSSFHDIKGVSAISLSMPTINSATNTTKGVNLGWNKVKGAEGYYVYRKTPSSNWVLIGKVADGATVSYLDTTAKSGTEYYYTVRAYSGSTLSSYKGKYVKYN